MKFAERNDCYMIATYLHSNVCMPLFGPSTLKYLNLNTVPINTRYNVSVSYANGTCVTHDRTHFTCIYINAFCAHAHPIPMCDF